MPEGTTNVCSAPVKENVRVTALPTSAQFAGNASAEPASATAQTTNNPTVAANTPTTRALATPIAPRALQDPTSDHPDPLAGSLPRPQPNQPRPWLGQAFLGPVFAIVAASSCSQASWSQFRCHLRLGRGTQGDPVIGRTMRKRPSEQGATLKRKDHDPGPESIVSEFNGCSSLQDAAEVILQDALAACNRWGLLS